ncbi:hypothetical protein QBC38DRAFT_497335 [Podospora fimiseda]|uniref:C3H1-type domain-containing protein n=1 Tax=Podospora fimiseda TaxID=252190 RepID=A0AAN7BUG0_9PEZI|nr:hypothetical protein QBC38DRAFT_497335 [Podospora fimiseda]
MDCRPRFFLIRKGTPNRIVPLIAVDELPEWINIVGCPRELKREDTKDLYNLGAFSNRSKEPYTVEILRDVAPTPGSIKTRDEDEDKPRIAAQDTETITTQDSPEKEPAITPPPSTPATKPAEIPAPPSPTKQRPEETDVDKKKPAKPLLPTTSQINPIIPAPDNDNNHNSNEQKQQPRLTGLAASKHASSTLPSTPPPLKPLPPSPSPSPISPSTTTYCRHWLNHGTCKYGRACKYKHEIPTSPTVLSALGLKEFPSWFTRQDINNNRVRELSVFVRELLLGGRGRERGGRGGRRRRRVIGRKDRQEEVEEEVLKVAMGRVEADLPIGLKGRENGVVGIGLRKGGEEGEGRLVDV